MPADANGLVWEHDVGELTQPVLVAAFEGWNDAADAASFATFWLTKHGETSRVAAIDPEFHTDFQARRPQVHLVGGVTRAIVWPETAMFVTRYPERDLVVVRGFEPSYKWRSFCRAIVTVAERTKCELVVTFGALLADTPHTREARITGTATDGDLIARLNLQQSRYEGPTGIVGVLHDACREHGLASVSLWAPVPHYISTPPNPPATLALLERFGTLVGVELDLSRVRNTAAAWRKRVDEVAEADDDIRAYVRKLEERFDAAEGPAWGERIPSGDELATEFERFLRDVRDE